MLIIQSHKRQRNISLQNVQIFSVTSKKSSVWNVHTKSALCGIQLHSWYIHISPQHESTPFLMQHGVHAGILYRVQGSSAVSE